MGTSIFDTKIMERQEKNSQTTILHLFYATSACNIGQNYYVSTNHGIYYQNGPLSEILEYMPSSNNLSLNDVYFYGFEKGYAVGNNGVFIKTTDSGGGSKPLRHLMSSQIARTR
ncbi:MAG: hypothetical protein IPO85_19935 [Saprospiraceae bacterium]|uniref:Uncharacterized protein n=1 Tax=Candidatus Defluviibacterium haderslevense TaxID=2981993 RepID=A0A9D7XGH2_9BACT|nr:hypothetical protein [Candidatus Defluviibacterium haderslevense]